MVLIQIIQIALCLTALAGDLFSDFPYFLFPLLCFPCFLGSLLSSPFSFNLSQDPISYLHAFMLKSIHTYRQKDVQMSAFYFEQKSPSQNVYKNGLLLSGDSFIKTEVGPPVQNGMEIETVKIYYDKHSNQR